MQYYTLDNSQIFCEEMFLKNLIFMISKFKKNYILTFLDFSIPLCSIHDQVMLMPISNISNT
jgi:hypothetical protein